MAFTHRVTLASCPSHASLPQTPDYACRQRRQVPPPRPAAASCWCMVRGRCAGVTPFMSKFFTNMICSRHQRAELQIKQPFTLIRCAAGGAGGQPGSLRRPARLGAGSPTKHVFIQQVESTLVRWRAQYHGKVPGRSTQPSAWLRRHGAGISYRYRMNSPALHVKYHIKHGVASMAHPLLSRTRRATSIERRSQCGCPGWFSLEGRSC